MANSLYDRNLQESTLFELFQSETHSDTLKALKLAQATITTEILAIEDNTWTKKRLTRVQKKINAEIAKAYSGLLPGIQQELPGIAEIAMKNMLKTNFTSVPTKVISNITAGTFNVQGYGAKELFDTISANHARQLRVIVGAGVAQGKPSKRIVNELMTKNSKLSKAQLKNAVFTTITEARAAARHESYRQMEKLGVITGYQYVATLDGRTTEYCRNHDGRMYKNKSIDEIQGEINVHFHCRSVFAPTTATSSDDTRASMNGEIPDENYSSWFSRQPDHFQKKVLGAKKYEAYKNGSYKIGGLPDVVGQTMAIDMIANTMRVTDNDIANSIQAKDKAESLSYYSDQDGQEIIPTSKFLKDPPDLELAYNVSNTFHGDYFEEFVEKVVNIDTLYFTQDKVFLEVVLNKLDNPLGDKLLPAIVSYKNKLYVVNGHHRLAARSFEGNTKTKVRVFKFDKLDD